MSLVKLPFIILTLLSYQVSLARPPSVKEESDRVHVDNVERFPILGISLSRMIAGGVLLVEAAVSYAVGQPSNPWSQWILQCLCHDRGTLPNISITSLFLAGVFCTLVGACIRVACYRQLGRFFTYELVIQQKHKLISTGPYAFVRHPSYTGAALVMAGVTMCEFGGSWWTEERIIATPMGMTVAVVWSALAGSVVSLMVRASKEDEMLQGEFGEEWKKYAMQVPYRFLPGII